MLCNNPVPAHLLDAAAHTGEVIKELDYVLLAAHTNLDGDALGSLAACGYILKLLDKQFLIYAPEGIPPYLRFLELPGRVYTDLNMLPFQPNSAIYMDCSDKGRLGQALAERAGDWPSVNIDHHMASNGLGTLANFIVPDAAATCQLMAYIALALGLDLKGNLGKSIALGLMTDTGWFANGNTSAEVFDLCAILVRNGCSLQQIRYAIQNNWAPGKMRLWGHIMENITLHENNKVALGSVSLDEFQHFHCTKEDLEGLVEWFERIKDIKIAALIREESRERCKFSLRSHGEVDVHTVASALGGGGHFNASGGTIQAGMEETKKLLLKTIAADLAQHRHYD